MFLLFLNLMTMKFIQQHKRIKLLSIAEKRSNNEHRLLGRIDVIDDQNLENSSTHFDINHLNSSFPKNQFNGTFFSQL